jgi:tRNA dimethylallyltransferase
MSIGTSQPTLEEVNSIPHHLISIREPNETVSAGEYADLVKDIVGEIQNKGKEPILCGGAGLYLDALTLGIFKESKTNPDIRERLSREYDEAPDVMLKKLKDIDPDYAEKVHINNKKRLIRALEIVEITGKIPTEHFKEQTSNQPFLSAGRHDNSATAMPIFHSGRQAGRHSIFTVLLSMERQLLINRIRERTKSMLENGWIEETKVLRENYSVEKAHALDSIGYRQICQYLDGEYSIGELEEEIVIRTRQFAKRQYTWFRNRGNPFEINIEKFGSMDDIADEIILVWNKLANQ